MADFHLLTAGDWRDYAVLDSGDGAKLEQVGPYRFIRPEPQALWAPLYPQTWSQADAIFTGAGEDEEAGRWRFERTLPEHWPLSWDGLTFLSRPTPFRHLAFFPEHSVHWRFATEAIDAMIRAGREPAVLNLFGYTGLASLACARAGAAVTHVDASKKAIGYARENQAAAGLSAAAIRWIADDALTFVKREIKRGKRYDGVILDPPKYGRGPNGETFRLETQLGELLAACAQLLRRAPNQAGSESGFMIATIYAVRLSWLALAQTAAPILRHGMWTCGEMTLPHARDARLLPTALFARWRSDELVPK
jgi:23S rRNA (cytosine1962-C5)-methyltransferase